MTVTDWLLDDLEPCVRETLVPSAFARQGAFEAASVAREWHDLHMVA